VALAGPEMGRFIMLAVPAQLLNFQVHLLQIENIEENFILNKTSKYCFVL